LDENPEIPKTAEELNALIENAHLKKENRATYYILSLLFPPFTIYLALFLSFRKKLLYVTLPAQLIFYAAITVVFNLFGLIGVNPPSSAVQLGVTFDQKTNSQVMILTVVTTILAFFCLALGIYFKNKAKKDGSLTSGSLWVLFLALNLLVYGVVFLMLKEVSLLFGSIAPIVNNSYQGL
jgi:hypothetical protein